MPGTWIACGNVMTDVHHHGSMYNLAERLPGTQRACMSHGC